MSNKEELAEDEVEVDSSSNETDEEFSDEQLFTPPTGEEALQVYLEDKYLVKLTTNEKLRDTIKGKLKENAMYCPCRTVKNKDTLGWCKDFRFQDKEGPCHCGLYVKSLADEEHLRKMRRRSLSKKPLFSKKDNK